MKHGSIATSTSFTMTRSALGLLGIVSATTLIDCLEEHGDDWGREGDSSIVFGIDQTKSADGKVTTSVGYDMLDVRSHGSRARGYITADADCWAERLDERLGQPKVLGGVALFKGGLLPANGIAVVANRGDDLTLDGAAWQNAGDTLTFEAKGFAMPDVAPSELRVPSLDLALTSPADPAADVPIASAEDLGVTWTPSDANAPQENVVVSLTAVPASDPGSRGVELRCFFDRAAGTGTFPSRLLRRFYTLAGGDLNPAAAGASSAITGKLHVATHRQLTIFAKSGWTVYVVATAEQREQPFSLTP